MPKEGTIFSSSNRLIAMAVFVLLNFAEEEFTASCIQLRISLNGVGKVYKYNYDDSVSIHGTIPCICPVI